jgi:hypothetical protein
MCSEIVESAEMLDWCNSVSFKVVIRLVEMMNFAAIVIIDVSLSAGYVMVTPTVMTNLMSRTAVSFKLHANFFL